MDLNLIRVFAAVYEEGSVTAAADRLHLAQPTVTQSLNRLRRESGEDLFVKSGRRIVPTRSAAQLYAEIGHVPAAVESAVQGLSHFDPATTVETFSMALTDLGQEIFLPKVVPEFARVAPNATLEVVNLDMDIAAADLAAGTIDIAVASTVLPGRLRSVVIRPDIYFCVARAGRFEEGLPPFEELGLLPRVVARGALGHTVVERMLPEPARGSVYLPGFSAMPLVIAATDLIAFVPFAVIDSWQARWDVKAWPLQKASFSALVRAHTKSPSPSAGSAWFSGWVTDVMRSIPYKPEE